MAPLTRGTRRVPSSRSKEVPSADVIERLARSQGCRGVPACEIAGGEVVGGVLAGGRGRSRRIWLRRGAGFQTSLPTVVVLVEQGHVLL